MSPIVVDASVIAKYLFSEQGSETARGILGSGRRLLAPDLVFAECGNVIWKRARTSPERREDALEGLETLGGLPVDVSSLRALTPIALQLALEYDHPIYDCYYVAAAIRNDCLLATADERLYDLTQRAGLGEQAILVR